MSLLLAATALEKMQAVPTRVWINIGIAVVLFIVAVVVLRKLAGVNKIWLSVVAFVVLTIVGFNWIYSRNEPAFLTPVIDKIAPFFPTSSTKTEKTKDSDKLLK